MDMYVLLENMQSTAEQRYPDKKTLIDTPHNGRVIKLNRSLLEEKSVYLIQAS